MPKYRVLLHGNNFLISMGEQIARHGFFVTRLVEATDAQSAEERAIQRIGETQSLRSLVRNSPDDRPVIHVTEIVEIDPCAEIENPQPGFVWYPETPEDS